MQKSIRANEHQLYYLVNKARDHNLAQLTGNLWKKSLDTSKWQLRYFVLYQNLLFYFDGERAERPSGVIFLESSYCEPNVNLKSGRDDKSGVQQGNYFTISYRKEGVRQYDLRADTEEECFMWVDAINNASFSKLLELKQQAEQKQLHLLQILETEQRAKWHYVKQIEELTAEIKQLKYEFNEYRIDRRFNLELENESEELRKIKKVQSFFRGWLCRRRWKQIVEEYIRSDHAESMRKRNSIVFGLVECEDEYVQQLSILVTCYLRPFRMAASSKKPIVTHEDVNSIFLNAEAVLFLHQVFVQGLRNKMENWPTLQLGDLFDLLLPMLGIYQEYVRNHHYSLQVLAEYKQRPEFTHMLKRLEEKPLCEGRSIESFLTYPMHQIPRYIITLHELLAHTPYDHVDRKKLEFATSKLEQISHIMHDEVSETENIRKNLAIERMIVDGCDLLLDVNQVFVRQGTLIQVMCDKLRSSRSRLGNFGSSYKERKEAVRQVFLFTNHLLITARTNNGKLRLVKNCGKISLVECTLVEDTTAELFNMDDEDQLNVTNEQKSQQDSVSFMTKSNIVQLLNPTPMNVINNSETNTRSSVTTTGTITTTHELGQSQLHKRYTCPDSTLNRYTTVNKSNSSQMDPMYKSTSVTSTIQQQQQQQQSVISTTTISCLPTLTVQHRHSTSLCISSTNEQDVGNDAFKSTNIPVPCFNTNTTIPANLTTVNTNNVSVLHSRNSSNVSYSLTPIITPDINIMSSSTLSTQPTSPSFSMLHRFSSNMGLFNSFTANTTNNSNNTCINDKTDYGNLDFRLIWEPKNGQPTSIWLVASTLQEKAAWCSDISQCIEQLHYGDILNSAQSDVSSVAMPQSIRSDPKLFKDDVDIKFSHTLNSCKVPQIRYATVSRLLDRLTDARFLSIDFLNTFLLTYRVFTTGLSVIWALNQVLTNPDVETSGNVSHSNQHQSFTYSHLETTETNDSFHTSQSSELPLTTITSINRLPVLEETVHSTIDDPSSNSTSMSQINDHLDIGNRINSISNELLTNLSLNPPSNSIINIEVSSNSLKSPTMNCIPDNVSIKLHRNCIPHSLSTSETDCSLYKLDEQMISTTKMNSSMIMDHQNLSSSSSLLVDKQSNKQMMNRQFQSSTNITSSVNTTTSSTMLIPRSPVYSRLVNHKDDPSLELPILSDVKNVDKKQNHCESNWKSVNSTSPSSYASTDLNESINPLKGHQRLAPLASCEVIPDESETSSKQDNQTTVLMNPILPDNINQSIPGEMDSVNSTLHKVTGNHLDNQLDEYCQHIPIHQEKQSLKSNDDFITQVSDEYDDGDKRYKHPLSVDMTKSEIAISVSCDNQSNEYFSCSPSLQIPVKEITENNLSSVNKLTISMNPSHSNIQLATNNHFDVFNHQQHLKLTKSTLSIINNSNDNNNNNNNDNNRLLENYLNQSIGSSLLSTECNNDRMQSRRSFDKTIIDDNIQQHEHLQSESKVHLTNSTELHNNTSNIQTSMKKSTVNLNTSSSSSSSSSSASSSSSSPSSSIINNVSNYFPVTDSLDLATRLTTIKQSPKSFTACQSLAKHTMITALNCSRALTNLKSIPLISCNRSNELSIDHNNDKHQNQMKYLNNYLEYKEIIHSSPSSPRKSSMKCSMMKNTTEVNKTTNIELTKDNSMKSSSVFDTLTNVKQSIQNHYRQTTSMHHNSNENRIKSKKFDTSIHESRQIIGRVKGKEVDNLDESKLSHEVVHSPTPCNNQQFTDLMLKDRKDSLLPQHLSIVNCARGSVVSWSGVSDVSKPKRPSVFSCPEAEFESPRPSVVNPSLNELVSSKQTRSGAVVTSSRRSKRRSSNTAAAQAFAVATAGSANPLAAIGIMGLGPNLFRSGGYRFSAGTATAAATQTGLRSGINSNSGHSISGNTIINTSSNSFSSSNSNAISIALINRSQSQNTPSYVHSLSPGHLNTVSPITIVTNGMTIASSVSNMTSSSIASITSTVNSTPLRLNLNRNAIHTMTTSIGTMSITSNHNSASCNSPFNFHSYNLTSPTFLQSSCIGVGSNTAYCLNQVKRNTMLTTASCLRVLNVVRHWITKFPDDFESDPILKREMQTLLDTLVTCPHLMPNDQKVANQLLLQMISDQLVHDRIDLDSILTPRQIPSKKNFDQLSALDISEQLTFLDFQIFRSIRSEELLNQSWMKLDKEEKAKHVLLVCKRFNEVSRLVVSEIISRTDLNDRVMCIDKWVAIADICRCMQNYNGVLQICSALVNSSVYRLKRTWERVSKQTKQSIDRLQMLVASDGRFKSMREALHRCDPPCIPYLGMYLTDLSFIEEGALNITENNLVNFCKMRMIAHVIREVQQYHQTPYLITHRQEVTDYLLDPSRLLDEEQTYQASLTIEPRQSINRQSLSGFT